MNRPHLTSPVFTQVKCQSSRSDFSSSPPPKGGEVGEVDEDRTATVQPQNDEVRWERSLTSTLADHTPTDDPRRAVSPFNDGDWPRGDPAEYFIEAGGIEAGRGLLQALAESQPSWRRAALCRDQPIAIFFPIRGQSNKPGLAVCSSCPVKADCLAEAIAEELDHGIRGGLTARSRVAARKAQATNDAERAA
jgi:WhiB family redox-sensing transcriptional regulator